MAAELLDGKAVAKSIRRRIKGEVAELKEQGFVPGLAVIIVGTDPASRKYVDIKKRVCKRLGILSEEYQLSADVTEETLLRLIRKINADDRIHALLVQRPLPAGIDVNRVTEAIEPTKDVDCLHPRNVGCLLTGGATLFPCTPQGVIVLLDEAGFAYEGAEAVIVGRSPIVGKPLAFQLLARHCTVTMCHSRTRELEQQVRRADLVVAATGSPGLIRGSWIKEGAWVVDVGTTLSEEGNLVGDVEFDEASERAARITPVPGGVGPMTIAQLMENTLQLARGAFDASRDVGSRVATDEEE